DASFTIWRNGPQTIECLPMAQRVVRECLFFITDDTLPGGNPESSIGLLSQGDAVIVPDLGRIDLVEDPAVYAIEPDDSKSPTEPNIAVLRLKNYLRRVLRQSLLDLPCVVTILRGFNRVCVEYPRCQQDCQCDSSSQNCRTDSLAPPLTRRA